MMSSIVCRDHAHKTPSGPKEVQQGPRVSSSGYGPLLVLQGARSPNEVDEDMTKSKGKDPLEGLGGPMTRARARKAKEALQQVLSILFEYKPQGEKSKVVSCIMAQMEED